MTHDISLSHRQIIKWWLYSKYHCKIISKDLTVKDFNLLVSLNVFNEALMNDAVYKFKRYEDSSLSYSGIDRHAGEQLVGGYSTVITQEEYQEQH